MIRVLVPIEAFVNLTLAATYFALEFAKRHPAKVYFLILAAAGDEAAAEPAGAGRLQERALFRQVLERAGQQQVDVEVQYSQEDYLSAVRRVVAQQGIDDIVIALPPLTDAGYPQMHRRLEQLRHQVPCHIITVKPKEVGAAGMAKQATKTPD